MRPATPGGPCPERLAAASPVAASVTAAITAIAPVPPVIASVAIARTRSRGHAALGFRQQRLARQLDLAVAVHADDLDHHQIADVQHVLDPADAMMLDLRDVQQPVAPRHDLDERPERDHAPHLALVHATDLRVLGDRADHLFRPTPALAVDRRDAHLAGILDVDLGAGLLGDALDHLAPRADDLADL